MVNLLKIRKGFSDNEIKKLLQNRKQLLIVLPNKNVVLFLNDLNAWIQATIPQQKFFGKITGFFKNLFKEDKIEDDKFFIELASVIYDFRKLMETGT
jgi:hypothetical protein